MRGMATLPKVSSSSVPLWICPSNVVFNNESRLHLFYRLLRLSIISLSVSTICNTSSFVPCPVHSISSYASRSTFSNASCCDQEAPYGSLQLHLGTSATLTLDVLKMECMENVTSKPDDLHTPEADSSRIIICVECDLVL